MVFFFFKQKTAYEIMPSLVGSEMCIRDRHEIDFKYGDALRTADNVITFKFVTKTIAQKHGLHASFMPKPIFGINGSGMHTNISLFKNAKNAFYDESKDMQVSDTLRYFV